MNPTYYFISDLHLGEFSTDTNRTTYRKIESFLRSLYDRPCELFILGDFFDFYFEYRSAIPKQCVRGLRFFYALAEHGVRVHYLNGNHDAWTADFMSREFNIRIYPRDTHVVLNDQKILLSHGDGHSNLDPGYRFIKSILRNRVATYLYRWLHPDIGIPLATHLAHASKQRDRYYEKYVGDESFLPWLETEFAGGTDIVMMGHHHLPQIRSFPAGKLYINLGDWIRHFTYAVLDHKGVRLEQWKE